MASVHKKTGCRYFYAFFKDSNGRMVSRSTHETDRKRAQRIADTYEIAIRHRKSARNFRAFFNEAMKDLYGEELPSSTVRVHFQAWLEGKKPETAPSSFLVYRKTVETFLDHLGPKADREISEVTERDVMAFRNALAARLAPATTNRYIKVLRMTFKAAQRGQHLHENPAEHVEVLKKREGSSRRPFTIPEIQAVLAVADPEWQSLIKFGLYTGQRLVDLASLTWANVDLQRDEIRLTTRKTGKRMTIPLASPLRAHLLSLPASDSPVTPLHPRAFDVAVRQGRAANISNWFGDLLAQAGLRESRTHEGMGKGRDARREGNQLSFHSLRHTAVSLLKDAGVPQATVQAMIGHDSESMSALYTHVGRESLQKAAKSFPEV